LEGSTKASGILSGFGKRLIYPALLGLEAKSPADSRHAFVWVLCSHLALEMAVVSELCLGLEADGMSFLCKCSSSRPEESLGLYFGF